MRPPGLSRLALTTVAATLAAAVAPASAETTVAVNVGVGASDNITRAPANGESSTSLVAGLDLTVDRQAPRVDTQVDIDMSYLDYLDGPYSSEWVGRADGALLLSVLAERLNWNIRDSFGQAALDPFQTPGPGNRENVNYFSTGPELLVPLGSRLQLRANLRYGKSNYETSPLDGSQRSAGLGLFRPLSAQGDLSLQVNADRFEFDETLVNVNYDRQSIFSRYQSSGGRTQVTADLGYNQIVRNGDKDGGPLVRLDLSREITGASTVTLGAAMHFSSAAESFSDSLPGLVGDPAGSYTVPTTEAYETRNLSAGWNFSRGRTSFSLLADYSKDTYKAVPSLNREDDDLQALYERRVRPSVRWQLFAGYRHDKYATPNQDADEKRGGTGVVWAFGRQYSLNLRYEYFKRTSANPLREFEENRGQLTVSYSPGRRDR